MVDLEALNAAVDAAKRCIHDLCDGNKRWTMSIPARPDVDPDLVISAALSEVSALIASLAAAEERAAKAENGEQVWRCAAEMRCRDLDAAIAQRDDLATTVAGLRGAIEKADKHLPTFCNSKTCIAERCIEARAIRAEMTAALAASPAEHAARIQAAALREAAEKVRHEYWCDMDGTYNIAADMLLAEADRLDKAVVK